MQQNTKSQICFAIVKTTKDEWCLVLWILESEQRDSKYKNKQHTFWFKELGSDSAVIKTNN